MVAVGAWQHFWGWGGAEDIQECDTAPIKSLTDPLPPILPLLTQSYAAHLSPTAALQQI